MKLSPGCKIVLLVLAGLLSTTNAQNIYSPNYPQFYVGNIDCSYTISSAVNGYWWSGVNLTMLDFYTNSYYDYVDIYQGSTSYVERRQGYYGYVVNWTLTSPVVLRFHTQSSNYYRGFNFYYSAAYPSYGISFSCDRSCNPTFNTSSSRSCGPSVSCYNICNQTGFIYDGATCPHYYQFKQSFYSYVSSSLVYECYSLCQNLYYQSSQNCSNDNADLCQNPNYAASISGCNVITTPRPSQNYVCYNPCNQTWFNYYGTSCPNYFSFISSSMNYVGWPLYNYVAYYQCYSYCQNINYTLNTTSCSDSNANLCLNPNYATTLPQCYQSNSKILTCYNPCNQNYSTYYTLACPQYSLFVSVSTNFVGSPYYSYVSVYQCYSYCQNRLYTSNVANCSNSNANLCLDSNYAGVLPECLPITTPMTIPSQTLNCYNPCNTTYFSFYGTRCPDYFRYMQSYTSFLTGYTTFECLSTCQNRYYTLTNVNCSNTNANPPQTQQCFNPCTQVFITVNGTCPNYFRYVGVSNVLVNGVYQTTVDCFSYCQNQYYSLSTGNCSNDNANLCLNTQYYPNGCDFQQQGTIESPNYPSSNLVPVQCTYTLTTSSDRSMQLRMVVFSLATCCEGVDISSVDSTTGKTYNLAVFKGYASGWTASAQGKAVLRYNSTAGGLGSAFQFAYYGFPGQSIYCSRSCTSSYYWYYYYDATCGYNSTALPSGLPWINNQPTTLTCVNPCTNASATFSAVSCPVYSRYVSSEVAYGTIVSAFCYSWCQNTYYTVKGTNCSNSNANLCENPDNSSSTLCSTTSAPVDSRTSSTSYKSTTLSTALSTTPPTVLSTQSTLQSTPTYSLSQTDNRITSLYIGIGILAAVVVLCITVIAVITAKTRCLHNILKRETCDRDSTRGETNIGFSNIPPAIPPRPTSAAAPTKSLHLAVPPRAVLPSYEPRTSVNNSDGQCGEVDEIYGMASRV